MLFYAVEGGKLDVTANKVKKGRRSKSEWKDLDASVLTRLMANRVARIEVLKLEIRELQKYIDEKLKRGF